MLAKLLTNALPALCDRWKLGDRTATNMIETVSVTYRIHARSLQLLFVKSQSNLWKTAVICRMNIAYMSVYDRGVRVSSARKMTSQCLNVLREKMCTNRKNVKTVIGNSDNSLKNIK